jgi:hypothetical protein
MPRRTSKPYALHPEDRDRPVRFATYDEAEAYARKAHARGCRYLSIEHDGEPIAAVYLDWRDRVVVNLTPSGAALVPLST